MQVLDEKRRAFLVRAGQGGALAATAGLLWAYVVRQQARAAPGALRPPGAFAEADFAALCIKCGACVQACSYDTLHLAFVFDLLVLRHGWCGHLCPLGAFYALLGRTAQIRVRFDAPTCTRCGECARVCPEPQVLNLKKAAENGMIASGECSNCGRCIPVCPEGTLHFDLRSSRIHTHQAGGGSDVAPRRTG